MQSVNPFTQEVIFNFKELSITEAETKINVCNQAYLSYQKIPLKERAEKLKHLATLLEEGVDQLAKIISLEMGKILSEAKAEVKKCAWVCRYYAENGEEFLKTQEISLSENSKGEIRIEPLGVIMIIMPWNFPFWQVFRVAAPAMMLGNGIALKHASNVQKCAELMEDMFLKAGFPEGLFTNLCVGVESVSKLIPNRHIKALSLTGSETAGRKVAEQAGKELKKCVLELGGSNAFIVLNDADLNQTVEMAVQGRFLNAGQSCIAAKRFLVQDEIHDLFVDKFKKRVKELSLGDPFDEVDLGPLAKVKFAEELHNQIQDSIDQGADLVCGGTHNKALFEPTILINVNEEMPVFREETFGPCAAILRFSSIEEAIEISNKSNYGLGVSVFTENVAAAKKYIPKFNEGAVFFNSFVKSDPRLPFGGVKNSGYGRELSKEGILEFANIKSVYFE